MIEAPTYDAFFRSLTDGQTPHAWQSQIAKRGTIESHLIRVPTGFGKTLGVLSAWLWNSRLRNDTNWPRRLVWCLPMRVLVEQTANEIRQALARIDGLWDRRSETSDSVGVYELMGGADTGSWHLYPERFSVLVGTQDMLLSRALNRGYASPRARWPMEFGLLNQDCLWVMDEVQLMDVGLATSTQLQVFRDEDARKSSGGRPCHSWWMSATLQKNWLEKSPDTLALAGQLETTTIPAEKRHGPLWDDVQKPCECVPIKEAGLARLVADKHIAEGRGVLGPTLVVVNRVERANMLHASLCADKSLCGTDVRLVHSRFRLQERKGWREAFLNRAACAPGTDRIIVATQVVEAGVDISAGLLISELAPWPSLVQRFGRSARWGGKAQVIVVDVAAMESKDALKIAGDRYDEAVAAGKSPKSIDEQQIADIAEGKAALPYSLAEVRASREALSFVADVAPLHLETFETDHHALLPRLYPYEPSHLLLRHEIDDLFDTSPDLSGTDIDISRFMRSGDERDVQVFWVSVEKGAAPSSELHPSRDEICTVPFLKARDWLCGPESAKNKAPNLKSSMRAWIWDWQDRKWQRAERRDLYPGQIVLVAADCGGYESKTGWNPASGVVQPVGTPSALTRTKRCWTLDQITGQLKVIEREVRAWSADELADSSEDDETLSATQWQTIATHGRQVGQLAAQLASVLAPDQADLFDLAGRWHDAGKAHPAFQSSIRMDERPKRSDLAKAPEAAWPCTTTRLYAINSQDRRAGFRHELASTLALFDILRRHQPLHSALVGPWQGLLEQAGMSPDSEARSVVAPTPLEQEVLALTPGAFNLLTYLVCSHHGKVRVAWHTSPADQKANDPSLRIRGIRDGETLPSLCLADREGHIYPLPESSLDLAPSAAGLNPRTGAGWTERVLGLLQERGPFMLAWLEALLRAADMRASMNPVADPLLNAQNNDHELARHNPDLAPAAPTGEAAPPLAEHSAERSGEHGLREGAGSAIDAGSGTRAPLHATRYLDTTLGSLSYLALAPHLARAVQTVEQDIAAGNFDFVPLNERFILTLHQAFTGALVPQLVGWRRQNVTVGTHTPPLWNQVPQLMRDYALDLVARLDALPESPAERLLETLAFAEGRLLYIHPFADFNGRATRLFLRWLTRKLDLPIVPLVPMGAAATRTYLDALCAADACNWQPLMEVWRHRFEHDFSEEPQP